MNLIVDYWEQLIAFVVLVGVLTRMKVELDVLKEKVTTLFEIVNKKEK